MSVYTHVNQLRIELVKPQIKTDNQKEVVQTAS